MLFQDACEKFYASLVNERQLSPRTVATYRSGLGIFANFLSHSNIIQVEEISTMIIRQFIMTMSQAGKSANSIDTWLAAIRSLYRYLLKKDLIVEDPTIPIASLKVGKRLPSFFKDDQMNFLLDQQTTEGTCNNAEQDLFVSTRDKAILELLYSSGLRVSELVGLDLNRIYLDDMMVKVLGKGRKERIVPLGAAAKVAIEQYLSLRSRYASSTEQALFVNLKGTRTTARNVALRLKIYAQTHNFGERIHPHKLRHSFATVMVSNSQNVRAVQEMLGHEKLSTTQIYSHSDIVALSKVYHHTHPRDLMAKHDLLNGKPKS